MFLQMVAGTESEQRIKLLLKFNSKFSDNTQAALIRHFSTGLSISVCALLHGIKQPNLQRSVNRLNEINGFYEDLKEYETYRISDIENQPTQGN